MTDDPARALFLDGQITELLERNQGLTEEQDALIEKLKEQTLTRVASLADCVVDGDLPRSAPAPESPMPRGQKECTIPILERPCEECNGSGKWDEWNGVVVCLECGGAGYFPTADGKRLRDFIVHIFRHDITRGGQ